jgi:transposase
MGSILGAEFSVAAGDLSAFKSADRLAAYAGLVPAAHDSGKRRGNNHRMRGETSVSSGSSTRLTKADCAVLLATLRN